MRPGRGTKVARVFGVDIRLDASWILLSLLIVWTFSDAFRQGTGINLSTGAYVLMGILAAILFFASLLTHELSHALVAKRKGIGVEAITLFIFGGVAQITSEPKSPGDEFQIAAVGPLTSIILALLFGVSWFFADLIHLPVAAAIFGALALVNGILAVFNLIPGFPLDGGRILRSAVWKMTGNLVKATRVASIAGRVAAALLVARGVYLIVFSKDIFGLWSIFLGVFLAQAAVAAYKQVLLKQKIEGVSVGSIMTPQVITIPGNVRLDEAVDGYFVGQRHSAFPVLGYGDALEGLLTLQIVQGVPRESWPTLTVRQVLIPMQDAIVAKAGEPLSDVADRLSSNPAGRFLVVDDTGLLVGILTPADIGRHLSISQGAK